MPPKRRVRQRHRRTPGQCLVVSAFAGLQTTTHPTAQLLSGEELAHRDYKPLFVVVQMTGTQGAALTFTLCGHDGDAIRAFGPYIVGVSVQSRTFRWPASTDWFPAGSHTLVKCSILPCAGQCPANMPAWVRFRATLRVADYNAELTSQHHLLFNPPDDEEGYVTAIE